MKRSEEQAALVKGVFCDAFLFYQKYRGKRIEPEYWDAVTAEFREITKKYNGANICGSIMLAVLTQLEMENEVKHCGNKEA